MQYCSLQHWTLLPSPVTSTTGCCFCFDSVSSFFLELFLHWSPVVYWAIGHLLTWGIHLSVSYIFAFSYCSWGSQGKSTEELVCCSLIQWTMSFLSPEERLIGSWAKQVKGLLFICLAVSDSVTPWTASFQVFLSFTISRSFIKFMSIELMMPSNHLILWHPLLLLPSILPNIRVFSIELALDIR